MNSIRWKMQGQLVNFNVFSATIISCSFGRIFFYLTMTQNWKPHEVAICIWFTENEENREANL